jgi:phage-related protein
MPATTVLFYREGLEVPVFDYLDSLPEEARDPIFAAMELLTEQGHAARRPLADYLEDGIYELRAHHGRVQYRLLYFFYGRALVILTHGFRKEARVPPAEIRRARTVRERFLADPPTHFADRPD